MRRQRDVGGGGSRRDGDERFQRKGKKEENNSVQRLPRSQCGRQADTDVEIQITYGRLQSLLFTRERRGGGRGKYVKGEIERDGERDREMRRERE